MSITATNSHASIWSSVPTALDAHAATPPPLPSKPNEAGGAPSPASKVDPTHGTPFQQLSSDLQSVLIQMQNAYGDGKGPAAG